MKTSFMILFLFFTVTMFSCREKPVDHTAAQKLSDTAMAIAPVPFSPAADSSITTKQMKCWSTCNSLLDSLTFRYADSFKTEDAVAIIRYQEDFINAQDKICVRAGLPGGYQEYKWILENMGVEKNRPILEAANAKSF
jgi:hypothetical protein